MILQRQIKIGAFDNIEEALKEPTRLEIGISENNSRMAQLLRVKENGNAEGNYLVKMSLLELSLTTLDYNIANKINEFESPIHGERTPGIIVAGNGPAYNPLDQWILKNNSILVTMNENKKPVTLKFLENLSGSRPGEENTRTFYEIQGRSLERIYNDVLNRELNQKFYKELDKATGYTTTTTFSFPSNTIKYIDG